MITPPIRPSFPGYFCLVLVLASAFLGCAASPPTAALADSKHAAPNPSPTPFSASVMADARLLKASARTGGATLEMNTGTEGDVLIQGCSFALTSETPASEFASPWLPDPEKVGLNFQVARIANRESPSGRYYARFNGGVTGYGGAAGAYLDFSGCTAILIIGEWEVSLPPLIGGEAGSLAREWRPLATEVVRAMVVASEMKGCFRDAQGDLRFHAEREALVQFGEFVKAVEK